VLAVLALAGCSVLEDESERGYTHDTLATNAAFTTADLRVITERQHPVTHQTVVCTEPSPDVAKAVSAAFAATAQASGGTGSGSGSGSLSGSTAEAVAELAGRSTALLGLRDGLFQACQAYANGAIGADAYALIISRYGQLMTTLFLAQDIASAATATTKALAQVNAPASTAPSGTGPAASPPAVANNTTSPPASPPNGSNQSNNAAASAPPGSNGPAAIARMNEDYMNLDYNFVHLLSVVCINQNDTTTIGATLQRTNAWLTPICNLMQGAFTDAEAKNFATLAGQMVAAHVLGTPIDPMAAASAPGAPKQANQPSAQPAKAAKATKAEITAAQKQLVTLGICKSNELDADGIEGPLTDACVRLYQKATGIKETGTLDANTLSKLTPKSPSSPIPITTPPVQH